MFQELQHKCEQAEWFIIKNSESFVRYFLADNPDRWSVTGAMFDTDTIEVSIEERSEGYSTIYVNYKDLKDWENTL